MKKLILILALVLAACGKKEDPHVVVPDPAPVKQVNNDCFVVTILKVEGDTTYMELDGEEPKARIARSGNWGTTGERFRYCE